MKYKIPNKISKREIRKQGKQPIPIGLMKDEPCKYCGKTSYKDSVACKNSIDAMNCQLLAKKFEKIWKDSEI